MKIVCVKLMVEQQLFKIGKCVYYLDDHRDELELIKSFENFTNVSHVVLYFECCYE